MKRQQIDQFFKILDAALRRPAEVILVGAGAASLMGHIRPSLDIDFEIRYPRMRAAGERDRLEQAIRKASNQTGLAADYSENVSHWSMIDFSDYRQTAVPYKKIGKLKIKIIAPACWTIGKMGRFYELDIQDMVQILRKNKVPAARVIRVWAKALKGSALSLELGQFREHVHYFLRRYAKKIWGAGTNAEALIQTFEKKIQE